MKNYIFLDFDGVMDTGRYDKLLAGKGNRRSDKYGTVFDPECIRSLKFIINHTDADIVVTSSWKMMMSIDNIRNMWKERNLPGKVIDTTPDVLSMQRGDEIEEWLLEQKGRYNYVIIDDLPAQHFSENQQCHFFNVDDENGLDEDTARRIVKYLNEGLIPKTLQHTCIGERHKEEHIPCQDYSLCVNINGATIAVVCDGHGGEPYFRSDIGARLAAEITYEYVQTFVKEYANDIKGQPFASYGTNTDGKLPDNSIYMIFYRLFANILLKWEEALMNHIQHHPLSFSEIRRVPKDIQEIYNTGRLIDKAYGTTLMVYVQTNDFWFAFHIGDGKLITFNGEEWEEPVPWDKACHDNVTTSLCDFNAYNEFRLCYQGDGNFPDAAFLCSDGLEDCFASADKLAEYYKHMTEIIRLGKTDLLSEKLKTLFPFLSKNFSQDDISMACVCNWN